MRKIAHCLPVVARPRLLGLAAATPESLAQVQVSVNDVARSVEGKREYHITMVDLLEAAKYLSLMFSGAELPTAHASRSATAGEVRVRMRGLDTQVTHGLEVWNPCRELQESKSKA
jgi:hypothetical protein